MDEPLSRQIRQTVRSHASMPAWRTIGEEPVAELWVIAVDVEHGVGEMRHAEIAVGPNISGCGRNRV
jgi:hypothetical protein